MPVASGIKCDVQYIPGPLSADSTITISFVDLLKRYSVYTIPKTGFVYNDIFFSHSMIFLSISEQSA